MFDSLVFKLSLLVILINLSNSDPIKCPSNQQPCGVKCYLPETHKCNTGFICPKDEGFCGNRCYNLTTQKCIWGLICLKSEQWCANRCFDPTKEQCRQGRISSNKNATNI